MIKSQTCHIAIALTQSFIKCHNFKKWSVALSHTIKTHVYHMASYHKSKIFPGLSQKNRLLKVISLEYKLV